ncbi:hypothetical protein [Pseudalkalibacillus caeni]|uniref:Lipoprotein n=1 Tax=Exobacillus caeni TaxID=2574798 RepID=A0A5R9EYC8_9BACL|nr:hypothetical protein [Pseudalkalibacillus caeni]TLS36147.1 hypothetical protein FCL54_16035 [Pseudalkalibacillus caeni]
MKKFYLLFLVTLVAGILTACTEAASDLSAEKASSEQQDDKKEEKKDDEETKKEEKARDDEETLKEEKAEEEKSEEQDTPAQPFKALEPSKDAKPLNETLTEEELAKMPAAQAQGGDRTRNTPAGQTLIKGNVDKTDGPLKNNRIVAFYGHPQSTNMGILGEMEPDALMAKLKEQTQEYSNVDPTRPAIPMIELIATVAQRNPGGNGKYYHVTSEKDIQKYADLAKENNALLMLDVQLGQDTPLHQVKLLEKWLKLPYVHLAIDPEFHVTDGQTPGLDLGQVDGKEVQEAVEYVSDLVEENNLPPKIVVVHQFMDKMITNKKAIKPADNVQVVLNFDGHGPSASKMSLYGKFVRNESVQYGGFKVFYKKEKPVLTPEEILKLDPNPAIINYQ